MFFPWMIYQVLHLMAEVSSETCGSSGLRISFPAKQSWEIKVIIRAETGTER